MKRLMRSGVLALFAAAAPWAAADSSNPVQWWRLDACDLRHPGKGDAAIACRTLEEAKAMILVGDAKKAAPPDWVEKVDFDAWMLIVVPCSGNADAQFDVEKVTDEDGKIFVWCVRENTPEGKEKPHDTAMAVLVKKTDGNVKAVWTDDTMKALRVRRDCAGGHGDKDMEGGACTNCRKAGTSSPKNKLCGKCQAELQQCGFCFKRVPGDSPLKK
ncbi:MAG: hypothetical protein K8T20_08645 [Planctomycetes bacterium]|nr:hypothetical protein [Planctomycetota bacterium]